MRKIISKTSIVLFAAALFMVGCKNETEQVFKLEMPEYTGEDKTTFGAGNTTLWTAGDPVLINSTSGNVQSSSSISFSSPISPINNMFYSFYAGRATDPSFNETNCSYTFTMPTSYTYTANQLQAPMVGQCSYIGPNAVHTIIYSNICTLLKLEFVVIPDQVTITSENSALAGVFTETYANGEWTLTAPTATSANKTLTISNPNYASVMYVPLPAGQHKLTITGKTFTKVMNQTVNMQKGVFYAIKCAHKFSVSASRQVFFSPGNFEYYNRSDYGSIANWGGDMGNFYTDDRADCARFSPNQWDRKLAANRQEGRYGLITRAVPATNTWIDLFGWGTGTIPGYNRADASSTSATIGYDQFNDWGTFYGDKLNNNSHCVGSWFTLSRTQWSYLLNLTSNDKRSGKCRIGSVNGVNGLIIAPDDFNQSLPQTISSTDFVNNYQKKGVVFLPAGGHMNYLANVNHSWGFSQEVNGYWTSTPVSGETFDYRKAYHVSLPNSNSGSPTIAVESMCRTALNNGNRPGKINVRLVQYAN